MHILIVILNYNGLELLKKHLPSVLKTEFEKFDILVVDNASTDESVEYLKKNFSDIHILESSENLGFGNGNNFGVSKYPNYDGYVFLNNDISVEKDWLTEMVKVLKSDEKIGSVGPKIVYSKKRNEKYIINSAGIEIDNHYLGYDRYDGEEDSKKYSVIEEVEALTGGALLIKKEVWDRVGGFNPKMFMYYEDVDISLRIKDLGYSLYYCGKSVVYHDHMGTTKSIGSFKRNVMNMKNRYISIGSRLGFLVAFTETIWYLFNWFVWKVLYSKKINLKEYLTKKNE